MAQKHKNALTEPTTLLKSGSSGKTLPASKVQKSQNDVKDTKSFTLPRLKTKSEAPQSKTSFLHVEKSVIKNFIYCSRL